jgi:predicted transcriptional regulator
LRRRRNGELESEVFATLSAAGRPLTAAEVAAEMGGSLAHTTLQTILVRLLAKGAVERELIGRAHAYTAVLDGSGVAASLMAAQLDKTDDRASVLSRFFQKLTPEDERTLSRLLKDQRKGTAP